MITLKRFVFNELGVNSFVLHDQSLECVIVDPGCNSGPQEQELTGYISDNDLKVVSIILTHGHFDHVLGLGRIKSVFNCPVLMHRDDLNQIEHIDKYAGIFGFFVERSPLPDRFISDGEIYTFGNSEIKIIHVPGHSPGSICLYSENDSFLICGDVIFYGSIGRTDLPGGNHKLLINGIRERLMILPRNTAVWPGHGPQTTIGHEHDTNPFLK
ncbi:MAG TPA: MBL fold metallo-hydrolase [Bacteroidales bacterium]|jgi:glyoxylase-like metal-dependent hydrolase (beta-lactamase superfamily II)|nr:MBL fold metallo-hydrolase [Bacteroidales bacterium]